MNACWVDVCSIQVQSTFRWREWWHCHSLSFLCFKIWWFHMVSHFIGYHADVSSKQMGFLKLNQGLHGLFVPRWLRGDQLNFWKYQCIGMKCLFWPMVYRYTIVTFVTFWPRTGGHSLWRPFVFFSPSRHATISPSCNIMMSHVRDLVAQQLNTTSNVAGQISQSDPFDQGESRGRMCSIWRVGSGTNSKTGFRPSQGLNIWKMNEGEMRNVVNKIVGWTFDNEGGLNLEPLVTLNPGPLKVKFSTQNYKGFFWRVGLFLWGGGAGLPGACFFSTFSTFKTFAHLTPCRIQQSMPSTDSVMNADAASTRPGWNWDSSWAAAYMQHTKCQTCIIFWLKISLFIDRSTYIIISELQLYLYRISQKPV